MLCTYGTKHYTTQVERVLVHYPHTISIPSHVKAYSVTARLTASPGPVVSVWTSKSSNVVKIQRSKLLEDLRLGTHVLDYDLHHMLGVLLIC